MSLRLISLLTAMLCLAAVTGSDTAVQAQTQDAQSSRAQCIAECELSLGECNSAVRRERQECARQAATGGNNPFTGRPDGQDLFCGYFNGSHCGRFALDGKCGERFARRYAECVEWTRGNIASRRYDCAKAESKATSFCRAELRDCKKACR